MNTRLLSGISLVVAVGLILAFQEIALASDNDPSPTITVQTYNYSQAAPATLSKAEREADRILSAAGLRVVWLECPVQPSAAGSQGPCQKAPEATDLRLRVLATPSQNKFQDTVFGFTVHPDLASVYYQYAVRLADEGEFEGEFEVPIILGCVIAHEIGHLLLGPNGHSAGGIMQPQWKRKQIREMMMGFLLFTFQQSKLIRAQARTRTRLQAVSFKE